ncbi:MAG: sensor histidine kinase [Candidatus Cloacimonetes bacterium]|jgi:two-component system sensor histidine kinase UhpB|nr:sensor histidine kinase [Candidatus Cloacimonadota bacterium]
MPTTREALASTRPQTRLPRFVVALLRVPLFYKILGANAVIAALSGLAVVYAVHRELGTDAVTDTILLVALGTVVLSLVVNAIIVRFALRPIDRLEHAASMVHAGDEAARAPLTVLADRKLARLIATFNEMLDRTAIQRKRLREVNQRALAAAEDERLRISRELHDGTAQTLAALRVRLKLARTISDPAKQAGLLEEISEEISSAIDEVRRMARGLRPPALDMLGLAPAIESRARAIAEAGGLRLELAVQDQERLLSPEAELAVYRIVQESLSNVVRHAGAETVFVGMQRKDGVLEIVVRDDGRGFDLDYTLDDSGRGLGLFGMQERASYIGGTVDIDTSPGRGTEVRVRVPITETERGGT